MAWAEADRAVIRHYLGFSALFLQADPRLEAAIGAVQSLADGGTRPDNSTELQIRGWLAKLAVVGGGPIFRHAGRIPLYTTDWLDQWMESRLGKPMRSTSDIREDA